MPWYVNPSGWDGYGGTPISKPWLGRADRPTGNTMGEFGRPPSQRVGKIGQPSFTSRSSSWNGTIPWRRFYDPTSRRWWCVDPVHGLFWLVEPDGSFQWVYEQKTRSFWRFNPRDRAFTRSAH